MTTYATPVRPLGFETDADRGFLITCSVSGNVSVASAVGPLRVPNAFGSNLKILGVQAVVGTAPATNPVIVDVNLDGTTIFTTQGNRPTVAAAATDSGVEVPDVTTWEPGEVLTVDVDAIGSGTVGANLTVTIAVQGG